MEPLLAGALAAPVTEFSRLFRLDALSDEPRRVEIEAGPDEREALARRFGLVAIDSACRRSGAEPRPARP